MKLSIQFSKSPSATVLSIPDDEMRSIIRQALADPDFRKMLDEELEKEKLSHPDLYESFARLIGQKGSSLGIFDAESLVEFGWTFVGDDDECWTLPLTELKLDKESHDIVFVFEDEEARFEEGLNGMPDDLRYALVEEFGDWL